MTVRSCALLMPVALSLVSAAPVLADGDIWLYAQNGQLKTGVIDEFPSEDRSEGVRVFHAELGTDVDNAIDEPGLRVLAGGLDPAGELSFTINRALRVWNGSAFDALSVHTMTVGFDTLSVDSSTTDAPVDGFGVGIDADGDLHDHYDFLLNAPTRTQGIWLLDLTFHFTGLRSADPVWVLFSQDLGEEAVEPAKAWAMANVPTPGALTLLGIGGLLAMRRRR